MNFKCKNILLGLALLVIGSCWATSVSAQVVTLVTNFKVNQNVAAKGYTVLSNDKSLIFGLLPGFLKKENNIEISQLDKSLFEFPEGWQAITDVYQIKFSDAVNINAKDKLPIRIKLAEADKEWKKIFYWDESKSVWQESDSGTVDERTIGWKISFPFPRFVVLARQGTMAIGEASWYKYKNCDCAASPDYPKGTLLKVKNLDNNKEITIKVNDFGPDRKLFPNRIIDLDKTAFKKLGSLGAGILKRILVTKI